MHPLALILSATFLAAPADKPAAPSAGQPTMDLTKVGPASRKPKDEKVVKKEVDDFLKQHDETAKKNDLNAMMVMMDFPVFMVTDDAKGVVEAKLFSKDEYVATMKPWFENMPKDMTTTHKYATTILSDALVEVTDDSTTTVGKQKTSGKSVSILVKREGKWMWKSMVEAGWGGMEKQPRPIQPTSAPVK
ncbi:MAG: hypothetical protein HY901_12335 [Deltaproteobacteria bacterium]|nr:hypothetical protein [Deltaproteobacteria bacterium]